MSFLTRQAKRISATAALCLAYLLVLITSSCIELQDSDLIDGCPAPQEADAVGIKKIFFSPYRNQQYASETDTVPLADFRFNFELDILPKAAAGSSELPGRALALSCVGTYNIRNVSNISVVLLEPFAGLPVGTDISYALIADDGKSLSHLRELEGVTVYFSVSLKVATENYSQLKTRTFLFLKDGTQKVLESTSPFLKIY
jgi:hypothetical protein